MLNFCTESYTFCIIKKGTTSYLREVFIFKRKWEVKIMPDYQFDIAKNAKVLDELKADLIGTVGNLYRNIIKGSQETIIDCLAAIIITVYIIGRRLGIKFYQVDEAIGNQLRNSAGSNHEVEKWFNDITSLKQYWNDMK